MKDNKGFTLLELIAAMAILVIVMASAMTFFVSGAGNYGRSKSDIDVQYEAQLAMNQIEDLLIDATVGIDYSGIVAGVEKKVLSDDLLSGDIEEKKLYIYNATEIHVITWVKAERKLYYSKYVAGLNGVLGNVITDHKLMSDYVTGFKADLKNLDKKGSVAVYLKYQKKDATFSVDNNVTLRNKAVANGDKDELYNGGNVVTSGEVTAVKITPKLLYVEAGANYPFSPMVTGTKGVPSQEVRWSITGNTSSSTKFNGNRLLVGSDETSDTFTVKAYSVQDSTKFSEESTVLVKRLQKIAININKGGTYDNEVANRRGVIASDTIQLGVHVTGSNLEQGDKEIKWSIKTGPGTVNDDGLVSINTSAKGGDEVVVVATSVKNTNIKEEIKFTITSQKGTIQIKSLKTNTGGDLTLNRRDSVNLYIVQTGIPNYSYSNIEWELVNTQTVPSGYMEIDKTAGIKGNQYHFGINQYKGNDLDFTQTYEFTLSANYMENGKKIASDTIQIVVPKVSIDIEFGDTQVSNKGSLFLALGEDRYLNYKVKGITLSSDNNLTWESSKNIVYAKNTTSTDLYIKFSEDGKNHVGSEDMIYPSIGGRALDSVSSITVNLRRSNISEGVGKGSYIPVPGTADLNHEHDIFETIPGKNIKCEYQYISKAKEWKLVLTVNGNVSYYISETKNGKTVWKLQ